MPWMKSDVDAATDPRMAKAGLHGRAVFHAINILLFKHGERGIVPLDRVTAEALPLGAPALLTGMPPDAIADGRQACLDAGLVREDDLGLVVVTYEQNKQLWPSCRRCRRPLEDTDSGSTCPECRAEEAKTRAANKAPARSRTTARAPVRERAQRDADQSREDLDPLRPEQKDENRPSESRPPDESNAATSKTPAPPSEGGLSSASQLGSTEGPGPETAPESQQIGLHIHTWTTWRRNSGRRLLDCLDLDRRLTREGATLDDVRDLWAAAEHNRKSEDPGGLFDTYTRCEEHWRSALTQHRREAPPRAAASGRGRAASARP